MRSPTPEAPPVHLVLRAHRPAPARVGLAYQSPTRRALLTGSVLLAAVAAAGRSAALPTGNVLPALALAAGLWAALHLWRSEYRVVAFVGRCPACGEQLRLRLGTRIRLPFPLACDGCGAECQLRRRPCSPPPDTLRHFLPDCPGEWRSEWLWDEGHLVCTGCGARHGATLHLQRLAALENEQGDLLARLTEEGRYL